MIAKVLLVIGGLLHITCGLFHVLYPKMFKWNQRLSKLDEQDKKAIRENLLLSNYTIMLFWLGSGIIPILFNDQLLLSNIGITYIVSICIFWIIRIFIIQTIIVGYKQKISIYRTLYFFGIFLMYFIPLFIMLLKR